MSELWERVNGQRQSLGEGDWVIDGHKYVVVCVNGALWRVAKRRIGLMRFGREPVYASGPAVVRDQGGNA